MPLNMKLRVVLMVGDRVIGETSDRHIWITCLDHMQDEAPSEELPKARTCHACQHLVANHRDESGCGIITCTCPANDRGEVPL